MVYTTEMIKELKLKREEYTEYINNHISNVKIAFDRYGEILAKKLNVPLSLLKQNIELHDNSKFSEEEFEAYRQYFYPCSFEEKDERKFNIAWDHHYQNNKHHPEYWVFNNELQEMPNIWIAEMLLDWEAMSINFKDNTYDYYIRTRDKKPFHYTTLEKLDNIIEIFKE